MLMASSNAGALAMRVAEVRAPAVWSSAMARLMPRVRPKSSALMMRRAGTWMRIAEIGFWGEVCDEADGCGVCVAVGWGSGGAGWGEDLPGARLWGEGRWEDAGYGGDSEGD